ncbi:MAG: hypothetical protein LLF78_05160 [Synergistaceae bacterium]|nr:hypothetical protein [Synergistaceae bacterium]
MHTYRCAECGHTFKTKDFAEKCPECRCRVLVHVEGERRKKKNCTGGNCASCGSSCTCH